MDSQLRGWFKVEDDEETLFENSPFQEGPRPNKFDRRAEETSLGPHYGPLVRKSVTGGVYHLLISEPRQQQQQQHQTPRYAHRHWDIPRALAACTSLEVISLRVICDSTSVYLCIREAFASRTMCMYLDVC